MQDAFSRWETDCPETIPWQSYPAFQTALGCAVLLLLRKDGCLTEGQYRRAAAQLSGL